MNNKDGIGWGVAIVQVAIYAALGWAHFFSRQNVQIPVSYIAFHFVAGLNVLFLAIGAWPLLARGAVSSPRLYVIGLSLPPIIWVAVLYLIKLVHRWF